MNRRILLIDADQAFRDTLNHQLGRYRFDIVNEPDADKAFAAADHPALMIVAVEEPDKAGFKIFQRCKKGALAKTPVLLVTSTVAPDSFAKHRSLKVHADEYLDKRSMNNDELVGKIDNLIGLGEPREEDDIPVEVDDIPMEIAEGDMVLEESAEVDSMVDAETDAAFAALLGDDSSVAVGPEAAVPAAIHDASRSDSDVFDTFSRESARPTDIAPNMLANQTDLQQPAVPEIDEPPMPPPLHKTDDDISVVDAVPHEVPHPTQPKPLPSPPRAPTPPPVSRTSTGPTPLMSRTSTGTTPPPVIDLGLDAIADEAPSDHSGVYDRRSLRKIGELERQIQQLKSELDRARTSADQASRGAGREREFLNLRETIIAKDSDLGKARADVAARDRELVDVRDKLRQAQQAKATAETKANELDQRLSSGGSRVSSLEASVKTTTGQLHTLTQELEARTAAATAAETARDQLQRELATERARAAAGASESERSLRLEREQLIQRHQKDLAAAKLEAANAQDRALEALRAELEAGHGEALAGAIATARDDAKAVATKASAAEIAQLHDDHAVALQALRGEHEGALQELRDDRTSQLQSLRDDHAKALREATEAQAASIERLANEVTATKTTAALEADRHRAEFDALTAAVDNHKAALEAATAEHAKALTEVRASFADVGDKHELDLATAAAEHHAELVAAAEQHQAAIAELEAGHVEALAKLKAELESTHAARAESLVAASTAHAAEIEALAIEHEQALAQRDKDHQSARAADAADHATAIKELKLELERQTSEHQARVETSQRELEDLLAKHEQDKGRLVDEHRAALQSAVEAESTRHGEAIAQLDEQRAKLLDDVKRAAAEHAAGSDRMISDLQRQISEIEVLRTHEAAEQVASLKAAKRMVEDAVAKYEAELGDAKQSHEQALAEHVATYERSLAVALGDHTKNLAVATAQHRQAIEALTADHDRHKADVAAAHAKELADLTTERDELTNGLSAARDSLKRHETELASAVQTIGERNADLRAHAGAIAERDQRIAELRHEIEALEQENANYQEQVLRAYQKIKSDEAMVARARKAMAIALTVLDDQGNPTS